MIRKIVNLLILLPLGIVLVVLCVANRQSVRLALNPFLPDDPMLSVSAPFFVFLFLALMLGLVLGAVATWVAQGKYRKRARSEAREAIHWHAEAGKQKARVETVAASSGLTELPSR